MSAHRRKGRRPETVPTQPSPVERTDQFKAVTLLQQDTEPVTETFPRPVIHAAPAPVHGPGSMPPLRPAPSPRPRTAWVPAQPPAPRRPPIRITEPAALAGDVATKWPGLFTLPCHTCHRVHTRGGTSSYRDLHAEAWRAGWRVDTFGAWACPTCQSQPGWRAPNTPAVAGEYDLLRDVAAEAADVPEIQTFRRALHRPRYYVNTSALEAATA